MAEVTAQMVKELRQKTGSGIALCKEALVECDGNFEAAEMYLRKKDKDKAAKKAERATGEGVVFLKVNEERTCGVLVEIACETDFVAKNEQFQALGATLLDLFLAADSLDSPLALTTAAGTSVEALLQEGIATIGENMRLRRVGRLEGGALGFYRHFNNKAASLVSLAVDGVAPTDEAVQTLGRDICMHITSCRPLGLAKEDIPEEVVAKEKEVYMEEVKGKPEEIQEKILQGKLGKFYAINCLTEQGFVKDDSVKVKDVVASVLKEAGGSGSLTGFIRVELGSTAACVGGQLVECMPA